MIENPSKDNLCIIIKFLVADQCEPMEIYTGMKAVYGDYNYLYTAVIQWCNKFRQRREITEDSASPGHALDAASKKM